MNVFILILTGAIGALLEIPLLLKQKMRKEMVVFIAAILVAVTFGVLKESGFSFIKPIDWSVFIFKPIARLIGGPIS